MTSVLMLILGLAIGGGAGAVGYKLYTSSRVNAAQESAAKILADADREAETKKKESLLEIRDEVYNMRVQAEQDVKKRASEIERRESKMAEREENLENKMSALERKDQSLTAKETNNERMRVELENKIKEETTLLEKVGHMTREEARQQLIQRAEEEAKIRAAQIINKIENEAKEEGDRRARNLLSLAIQRIASDHTAETTVSVVPLPSDEVKGRVIGREGRNIRAFETLTGVNLIIDDTPEAVTLSSFDPVRREIARLALEKLIADGRIHPARIEDLYNKSKTEVEQKIREEGDAATLEADVHGLHPELVKAIGRLRYRTSYGQNVLRHSIEVSNLAGIMANELGADVKLAKRAGLLHDIGKAVTHEVDGPHAAIGSEIAKRLKESPEVCHAIAAHHGEIEPQTVEAVLVSAADAVSASRPGARRETLESYVKRLEKLETIAESFDGVEKSFAMQAGREIRVMVKPEDLSDIDSAALARNVAKQIEDELEYPGQIKVTVIRETRAVEYAK
jgi:ribonuclease Y